MNLSPELIERIELLDKKYQAMGQDLLSYLDGLLHSDYLTYWDYIHLDVLLNLQTPRTKFPDEKVFILYHQITELYFKLILTAIQEIADKEAPDEAFLVTYLTRINRYFENLTNSFGIMIDGMEKEQFLQFRMTLLPASGFQSAQYRMIEIAATEINNLVAFDKRDQINSSTTSRELFDNIYWKQGATELATGKKTLTLRQFEDKYSAQFLHLIETFKDKNLWKKFQALPAPLQQSQAIRDQFRELDANANVRWPLVHYRSAVRYLQKDPEDIAATGGTNWQKYMPPKNQRIIFYPELWSEQELEDWGKIA